MVKETGKFTAVYVRVSTNSQDIRSQLPDLERWIAAQGDSVGSVRWYIDKASGRTMDRPQWNQLQVAITANMVSRLVVWRLDRLGRTASGLCKLFDELQAHGVGLVSLKDCIDLGTASGRLVAGVLASVASFETEVRAERVQAGQAAAKAAGKTWGGSRKGRLHSIAAEQVRQIVKMKEAGEKIASIARTVRIDRPSVYRILERVASGHISL